MKRDNTEQSSDSDHQRGTAASNGGMSSHPPDLNSAQISNAEKLEKDLKSQHDAPIEQHRSSRRPRPRKQHNSH